MAEIARELELGERIQFGPGELKSGGFRRASILADALEAVIGAVYIDGGFAQAQAVVRRLFASRLAELPDSDALKDPKTRLQEWLQARNLHLPSYRVSAEYGEQHRKSFEVTCTVAALAEPIVAEGRSRRAAEQAAARLALEQMVKK